jgi:hypothetical protein
VVIKIGRKRSKARLKNRVARIFALFAFRREREVHHHDRIFFHDADEQQNADDRDDAQILLKISSASTAPTPADGSVERIVIG